PPRAHRREAGSRFDLARRARRQCRDSEPLHAGPASTHLRRGGVAQDALLDIRAALSAGGIVVDAGPGRKRRTAGIAIAAYGAVRTGISGDGARRAVARTAPHHRMDPPPDSVGILADVAGLRA